MPSDGPRAWRKVGERPAGSFRIFRLIEEDYVHPLTGKVWPMVVLVPGDWVNVVPVTTEGKVVLIRQFRAGQADIAIEVPGGMIDPGEDPVAAGVRELLEETGYEAGAAVQTARIRPNPAIQRNFCHLVLATGCRPTGASHQEASEDVHAFEATWEEIDAMVADGRIDHALVLNALTFARARLAGGG